MQKRYSKFAVLALVAGLLLASGEFGVSVAGAGSARSPAAPGDLLSDGYDALGANRFDLARKIFQTLLNAYPQSTEAATAADELAALNGGDDPDDGSADESNPPALSHAAPSRPLTLASPRKSFAAKPEEELRGMRLRFLTAAGDRVFFAENSSALGGRARAIVEAQARWLKKAESLEVTVIGRAADGGSASDNKALSLERAKVVQAKLIEAGVDPSRIVVEGRGSADPIATCTLPLCDAQNRHVESLIRYRGEGGAKLSSVRDTPEMGRDGARDSAKSAAR